MIRLEHVHKYFNRGKTNEIHVINDTTLELESTGLVALLGPSGCGKTTLLNAVGGLDRVQKGDIYVNGERLTRRRAGKIDAIRAVNIGYIFQDYKLQDSLTVYENVAIALRMIGWKDETAVKERVDYVLNALHMYRYRNRKADMLSGGERQRVGIARALAKNPRIIIADEPTGNLDSANSLETMNIIKAISRTRLVVLVTHEEELARFYASRIIELKDGAVVADYENESGENLDYRVDNALYLKDFDRHTEFSADGVCVDYFGSEADKAHITLCVRGGNVYVQADGLRVEPAGEGHAVHLKNDHYTAPNKSLYEAYEFSPESAGKAPKTEKYHSVLRFFPALKAGFKKVGAYTAPKKLLLAGFLLAGAFVVYATGSIAGSLNIQEESFIQHDRSALVAKTHNLTPEQLAAYETLPGVDYVLPVYDPISFRVDIGGFYQTNGNYIWQPASLCDAAGLTENDLLCGRLPQTPGEAVIDRLFYTRMAEDSALLRMAGLYAPEDLLGREMFCGEERSTAPLTVVGVANLNQPAVYAARERFPDICWSSGSGAPDLKPTTSLVGSPGTEAGTFYGLDTSPLPYTLKEGVLPKGAYEMLVPFAMKEIMPLGKPVKETLVNGKEVTVTGYYESPDGLSGFLVPRETLMLLAVGRAEGITAEASDKSAAMAALKAQKLNILDAYEADRADYINDRKDILTGTLITALIMLTISLIEILLMTRSSFLSRIREVGIYRAIGVKKTDIYKMFTGEVLAVTTVGSIPGAVIMTYVLYHLAKMPYIGTYLVLDPPVVICSVTLLYLFNALVGLIPVFFAMRKPPAAMLTRNDAN